MSQRKASNSKKTNNPNKTSKEAIRRSLREKYKGFGEAKPQRSSAPKKQVVRPTRVTKEPIEQQGSIPQVQWITVDEGQGGQRLDNYLVTLLKGVPKSYIYRIIRSGEVRINKGRAEASTRIEDGDEIRVPPVRVAERESGAAKAPAKTFPVLYEDKYLMVLDKPAGTAVHGGSGISFGLIEQLRQAMPEDKALELVHRLDRDTSGAIIIARRRSTLTAIQQQFRDREPDKIYLALVKGVWSEGGRKGNHVIDLPLLRYLTGEGERRVRVVSKDDPQGRRSVSIVRLVQAFNEYSLLSVTIKTGRTHQIRVHLKHLGYPIVGDEKYGDFEENRAFAQKYSFPRMFLHASELSFEHPQLLQEIAVKAPLPPDCEKLIKELEHETNA